MASFFIIVLQDNLLGILYFVIKKIYITLAIKPWCIFPSLLHHFKTPYFFNIQNGEG